MDGDCQVETEEISQQDSAIVQWFSMRKVIKFMV